MDGEKDDFSVESGSVEECDARPEECVAAPIGDDDRIEFVAEDELDAAFVPTPLASPADPVDGLPRHDVDPPDQGVAPPLTYDSFICLEDDREYVEMWEEDGAITTTFWAAGPCGGSVDDVRVEVRSRYDKKGFERERRRFDPQVVTRRWGIWIVSTPDGGYTRVRPRRERCINYKCQVLARSGTRPGEFGHLQLHRSCMAKRSNGGAYMGLNDEAVYSCDFRSPVDERTKHAQDERDKKKMRERPDLTMVPAFGIPGVVRRVGDSIEQILEEDLLEAERPGGIFK